MSWACTWSLASLVLVAFAPRASTECAGATFEVAPRLAAPGDTVTLEGAGWIVCNDTPTGCGRADPTPPQGPVDIAVVPATPERWNAFDGGGPVPIGDDPPMSTTAVPTEDGDFAAKLRLSGISPGEYFVVARGRESVATLLRIFAPERHGPN